NVYPDLTGMQNLTLIGELYGVPKKINKERAEKLLKQFELFEKRNFKTRKYSKGMKQRLLLCMALMNDPIILFLDEPIVGLDVQSAKIIKQLIKEYNQNGTTIFLTTHDMEVANELCDRIAIINKGKIVSLDTPENLKKLFQEFQEIDVSFNQDINKEEFERLSSIKKVKKVKDGFSVIVYEVNQAIIQITDFAKNVWKDPIPIKQIIGNVPEMANVYPDLTGMQNLTLIGELYGVPKKINKERAENC
ncbi:unnamed protein product, partial [marine sediment metagenome]